MTNKIDTSNFPLSSAVHSAAPHQFSQLEPVPPGKNRADVLVEMGQQIDAIKVPKVAPSKIDWKARTQQELQKCIDKGAMTSIVMIMSPDMPYADALAIVHKAYDSKESLFSAFTTAKKLSLFAKIRAALFYLCLYRCGILRDTLSTFLRTILKKGHAIFEADEGTKRLQLLDKILDNAKAFLAKKQAGERFNGESKEEKLKICREFTQTAIREYLPDIPVLPQWKNHSNAVVSTLASLFLAIPEKIFNRILRSQIEERMPVQMAALWNTSIDDLIQETNLTLRIAVTKTLKNQFLDAKKMLGDNKTESSEPIALPPASKKKIEETIQSLLRVLRADQTASWSQVLVKGMISQSIEAALVEGCHSLCKALTDKAKSHELFALILELSNLVFEPNAKKTAKELNEEYTAEEKEMRKAARDVFEKVIHRAVKNKTHIPTPQELQKMADQVSEKERALNQKSFQKMVELSGMIQKKLQSPDADVTAELGELCTACDQIRTESTNANHSELPASIQQGIEESMKRIEWNLTLILKETKTLLKAETKKVSDRASSLEASVMRQACEKASQFYDKACRALKEGAPIPSQDTLKWNGIRQALEKIATSRDPKDPKLELTRRRIDKLERLFADLENMQATVSHLQELRKMGEEPARTHGRFFHFHSAAPIYFHLRFLPPEYRQQLLRHLHNLQNPSVREKWNNAWQSVANDLIGKMGVQQNILKSWDEHLKKTSESDQISADTIHQSCVTKAARLSEKLALLSRAMQHLRIEPIPTLQDKVIDFFRPDRRRILGGAALGAAAHLTLSALGHSWLATGVNLLGGAIAGGLSLYSQGINRAPKHATAAGHAFAIAPWATATAIGSAALAAIPVVGGLLSAAPAGLAGAYIAQNALDGIETASESLAYPEVSQTFDSLYDFILQSDVWKWALRETLNQINKSYN